MTSERLISLLYRLLPVWFAAMSIVVLFPRALDLEYLGADAHLYWSAAHAYVNGQDPWNLAGSWEVYQYSGMPPTVLAFVPFVVLPYRVTMLLWVVLDSLAAVYLIRRFGLPWWWILFPPVLAGIWIGNPHLALLGLLFTRFAPIAPLVKVYTAVPMVGERRWRQLAVCGGLFAATVLIAPGLWRHWLDNAGTISERLVYQAENVSAWGVWPLWLLGVGLLLTLGLRRAGWLAVPVLWPSASLLYGSMVLPVATPVLGAIMAIPLPGMAVVAVAAEVGVRWLRRERGGSHAESDPRPLAIKSDAASPEGQRG